jgi:hypothetical protein
MAQIIFLTIEISIYDPYIVLEYNYQINEPWQIKASTEENF